MIACSIGITRTAAASVADACASSPPSPPSPAASSASIALIACRAPAGGATANSFARSVSSIPSHQASPASSSSRLPGCSWMLLPGLSCSHPQPSPALKSPPPPVMYARSASRSFASRPCASATIAEYAPTRSAHCSGSPSASSPDAFSNVTIASLPTTPIGPPRSPSSHRASPDTIRAVPGCLSASAPIIPPCPNATTRPSPHSAPATTGSRACRPSFPVTITNARSPNTASGPGTPDDAIASTPSANSTARGIGGSTPAARTPATITHAPTSAATRSAFTMTPAYRQLVGVCIRPQITTVASLTSPTPSMI